MSMVRRSVFPAYTVMSSRWSEICTRSCSVISSALPCNTQKQNITIVVLSTLPCNTQKPKHYHSGTSSPALQYTKTKTLLQWYFQPCPAIHKNQNITIVVLSALPCNTQKPKHYYSGTLQWYTALQYTKTKTLLQWYFQHCPAIHKNQNITIVVLSALPCNTQKPKHYYSGTFSPALQYTKTKTLLQWYFQPCPAIHKNQNITIVVLSALPCNTQKPKHYYSGTFSTALQYTKTKTLLQWYFQHCPAIHKNQNITIVVLSALPCNTQKPKHYYSGTFKYTKTKTLLQHCPAIHKNQNITIVVLSALPCNTQKPKHYYSGTFSTPAIHKNQNITIVVLSALPCNTQKPKHYYSGTFSPALQYTKTKTLLQWYFQHCPAIHKNQNITIVVLSALPCNTQKPKHYYSGTFSTALQYTKTKTLLQWYFQHCPAIHKNQNITIVVLSMPCNTQKPKHYYSGTFSTALQYTKTKTLLQWYFQHCPAIHKNQNITIVVLSALPCNTQKPKHYYSGTFSTALQYTKTKTLLQWYFQHCPAIHKNQNITIVVLSALPCNTQKPKHYYSGTFSPALQYTKTKTLLQWYFQHCPAIHKNQNITIVVLSCLITKTKTLLQWYFQQYTKTKTLLKMPCIYYSGTFMPCNKTKTLLQW